MQRIRILRVITWLPVGGIERRLVALLPRLDRERFDVRVVCIRERGELADELEAAGIPVTLVPLRSRWDPRGLRELAGLMRRERIDVVHSHMYRSNVPATVAARLAGVREVWAQVHNVDTWETGRQAWMDRRLMRWRTGMIAVSDRVRHDVIETLRIEPRRVRVIYNGVDLDRFRAARERRAELRLREDTGERLVFIFMARLVEQKRPQDFLEAFGRLQREDGGERLSAWIVGDGPLRAALERQAAALPCPEAVRFHGRRDDVEELLAAADVFVMTSTKEGFSNALVEAMATGLGIVATDVGGNAEAVRGGQDGLIVPPADIERLTRAMRTMWHGDDQRLRMAGSARGHAEQFSLAVMIDATERLYLESLERAAVR